MPFDESPVGGMFLIIPAIRSPNYHAGTLGWTINVDGTAQFFNVTIVGNDLKVLGANGSVVELTTVGNTAEILVQPGGGNVNAAAIAGGVTAGGQPELIIRSPQQTLTTPNGLSSLILAGANAAFPASFANMAADSVQINGLAGTSGAGSAGLNLGGNQGTPAVANLFAVNSSIGLDGGGLSIANNVTIATSSLSLLGLAQIDDGSNRRFLVTHNDQLDSTANLTLAAAAAPILGCTVTYTGLSAGTKWSAVLYTDAGNAGVAGVNTIGELTVNANGAGAITQAGQAIWRAANTLNGGSMPSRSWSGTFAAGGTLVFQGTGRFSGGGGVNTFASPNTTLHVTIYE